MPRHGRIAALGLFAVVAACQTQPSLRPTPSAVLGASTLPPSPAPVPTAPPLPSPLPSGVAAAFTTVMLDYEGHAAMPVLLFDRTGLVTGTKSVIRDYATKGVSSAIAPDEGLEFVWGTGACDPGATITFERAGAYAFRLILDQREGTSACLAVEIVRDLVINVSEAIPPEQVLLAGDADREP